MGGLKSSRPRPQMATISWELSHDSGRQRQTCVKSEAVITV